MKKVLFSLLFLSFIVVGAQAQKSSCSKTCTKPAAASASCHTKAPSVASASFNDNSTAAAKVASMDATIESRTCPVTGNVSYVRKETDTHSGNVSYVDVNFDAATNTFVNVSPVKMEGSGCSKTTTASGKACCVSGASAGKSCCASKAKTAEKVKS